jgi:hypothetical protein
MWLPGLEIVDESVRLFLGVQPAAPKVLFVRLVSAILVRSEKPKAL